MNIGCFIAVLLQFYAFVLLARVILSWITMFRAPSPSLSPLVKVIYDLTEPILGFVRRYIPPVGGLDLSPLIIFLLIPFVRRALC
jgi:YggT family protein